MEFPANGRFDIANILDDGAWSLAQKGAVILAALAIILDGFDGQLIGFAVPVLIKEWGISREAFAPVVAAGLVGMAAGSAVAGYVGDRFGRRNALIGSVGLFGLATCVIGLAPNLLTIGILRFIAGLGIGGTLPSATTLAAEFTPLRRRAVTVTATIVCFPFGGIVAGVYAAYIMPAFGWRGLFLIGGIVPVAFALVLIFAMPESPRYLAHHVGRWAELVRFLRRTGRVLPDDATFSDRAERSIADQPPGFAALFEGSRARDTVALWISFFACLFAVYTTFSWLPAMLIAQGVAGSVAGAALTAYNFGGVLGALLCATAITRFGSRWPMALCSLGGAAVAFLMLLISSTNTTLLVIGFGLHGLFVNAVNSTLYAVSAFLYPTDIRARGTATALAIGRFGAILSSFVGAAVITFGGASAYLAALGLAMVAVTVALLALRRHIEPTRQVREENRGGASLAADIR